jgi:2-desacetyl-2-hydroxyethyl bacteriochlorophyllide A dehydrogenase
VGKEVKDFNVGDRVVCETWGGCGLCYYCRLGRFNHCLYQKRIGQKVDGGMAKYMVVPSLSLYKIPEALSYDQGAVVEPLGVALHAFERSHIKPGDDLAVIGPGAIGLLGAMLAQAMGIGKLFVIGLDLDKDRLKVAGSLGARTLVANRDPVQETILQATDGMGVDAVLDTSGSKESIPMALKVLKQGGEILEIGIGAPFSFDYVELVRKEAILIGSYRRLPSTWMRAINLIANKKVDVNPVLTHLLPLGKAKEGFEALIHRKGLKVILNP